MSLFSACVYVLLCVSPSHVPVLSPSPSPVPLTRAPRTQQSLKADSRPLEGSATQLPILADMLLYYCRFAARPVLLQVYQTEVSCLAAPGLLFPQASWQASWPCLCLWAYRSCPHPVAAPALCWRSWVWGPHRRSALMLWSCPLQLTFITGEKTTEIFIHSLELGHSAATRAIKASGERCPSPGGDRWGLGRWGPQWWSPGEKGSFIEGWSPGEV